MIVHLRSLEELAFLVQNLAGQGPIGSPLSVLFDAQWARQPRRNTTRLDLLRDLYEEGVREVYVLSSRGNDDVEKYIVEGLELDELPALAHYHKEGVAWIRDRQMPRSLLPGCSLSATVVETFSTQWRALRTPFPFPSSSSQQPAFETLYLFVAGDKSSVGKSSTCLALLTSFLALGMPCEDLGYIKPVTQCEAEQLVTRFCRTRGITCVGVGPVVFYKGFTRAFLAGETEPGPVLVARAVEAVRQLGIGKRVVLVDGVGYPAVGSICGVSNADVAQALGSPVLLVGKSGVGDAVDSYNLNAAFFEVKGVRVLGGVFNKLAVEGFYSRENCAAAVGSYFQQYRPSQRAYGFVPLVTAEVTEEASFSNTLDGAEEKKAQKEEALLAELAAAFAQFVQVPELVFDLWLARVRSRPSESASTGIDIEGEHIPMAVETSEAAKHGRKHASQGISSPTKRSKIGDNFPSNGSSSGVATSGSKRSREEIEAAARNQGARGG